MSVLVFLRTIKEVSYSGIYLNYHINGTARQGKGTFAPHPVTISNKGSLLRSTVEYLMICRLCVHRSVTAIYITQ